MEGEILVVVVAVVREVAASAPEHLTFFKLDINYKI
jgi:hypothetical protein